MIGLLLALSVNAAAIHADLESLCVDIGVRSSETQLDATTEYIAGRLESMGYQPQRQWVSSGSRTNENIWIEIGDTGSNPMTLVMGHQDTVGGSVGCGDDAFSAAVLLDYAESLRDAQFTSGRGLILFWPQFEETGSVGSRDFEAAGHADRVDKAISLETLSWRCSAPGCEAPYTDIPDSAFGNCNASGSVAVDFSPSCASGCTGQHMYISRDDASGGLEASVRPYLPGPVVVGHVQGGCDQRPEFRRSDHQWFWDRDTPAILISSGASSRTSCYHGADNQSCPEWDFAAGIGVAEGFLAWLSDDLGVEFPDPIPPMRDCPEPTGPYLTDDNIQQRTTKCDD